MPIYPFTALVGQQELQLGLLLNAINPAICGILIRGEKGTAKSTAVRGLAELLTDFDFNFPLVNLPLNATEDMVVGSINFQKALQQGEVLLQPGLLNKADGGILYVDEVNLLDDHLVDLILDTAASGVNRVEREGVSESHSARFLLVGTMNPEEGELRPQLLDRFGFCVEVKGLESLQQRVELLKRREAFDEAPRRFCAEYAEEQKRLGRRIAAARKQLSKLHLSSQQRGFIVELVKRSHVAGHRAELVLEQAALACAALEGAIKVTTAHITRVAPLVLAHRSREAEEPPPEPPPPSEPSEETEQGEENSSRQQEQEEPPEQPSQGGSPAPNQTPQQSESQRQSPGEQAGEEQPEEARENEAGTAAPKNEHHFEIGAPFNIKPISTGRDRRVRHGSGRRSRSRVQQKQGRYIRAALPGSGGVEGDLALDATLRAAAPWQRLRQGDGSANPALAVQLRPVDIRHKVREKRLGNLLLFVVDGSGSMGARGRMTASKGAVMSLLLDAYQKRDKVAMVSFRGNRAWLNLPVTGSVELAARLLAEMPVGGRTPLSAGLVKGYELVQAQLRREPATRPIVIVITDGKCNVSLGTEKPVAEMERLAGLLAQQESLHSIVVDTEVEGPVNFGLARRLAECMGADYFKTEDLQAEQLVQIVRQIQE